MDNAKQLVKDFWNQYSCGEQLYMVGEDMKTKFKNQIQERMRLEPFITDFADFSDWTRPGGAFQLPCGGVFEA